VEKGPGVCETWREREKTTGKESERREKEGFI
jgi:hypothetical protein